MLDYKPFHLGVLDSLGSVIYIIHCSNSGLTHHMPKESQHLARKDQ